MSLKSLTSVWEDSRAKHGALLVALALADEIRREHGKPVAWPSKLYLAGRARLTEATIDRAIAELVALHEVVVVPDDELDMHAKASLGKTGSSNLYILCVGQRQTTVRSVEAWVRGGQIEPPQKRPPNSARQGGSSAQNGGDHFRGKNRFFMDGTGTEPDPTLFDEPPAWAVPGVHAAFERDGKRLVGEIVERPDGGLGFRSPAMPFTTMPLTRLLGHLVPIADPPEPASVEPSSL